MMSNHEEIYDVVVIGGGVVGLSILRTLCVMYPLLKLALVERSPHLCDGASGRNSGILCTGVDAPVESLERSCIRDSISTIRPYLQSMNIPHRPRGSIVALWKWDVPKEKENVKITFINETLTKVAEESWDAGDANVKVLSKAQDVLEMEPHLKTSNDALLGGVHIDGEIVVDPWLLSISYAVQARYFGAKIYTNWECDSTQTYFDAKTQQWTLTRRRPKEETNDTRSSGNDNDQSLQPNTLKAKIVINACGINCDTMQTNVSSSFSYEKNNGEPATAATTMKQQFNNSNKNNPLVSSSHLLPPSFVAKPRRGQYIILDNAPTNDAASCNHYDNNHDGNHQDTSTINNLHLSSSSTCLLTRPIQPVPTNYSKGIFVFSSIYDQIVIGPTALDQPSKIDDSIDSHVRHELLQHGRRILNVKIVSPSSTTQDLSINDGISSDDHDVAAFDKFENTCSDVPPTIMSSPTQQLKLVGEYVGIRPGTNCRDYQIQCFSNQHWITVGGIRSTGLTASMGIGRYVSRMVGSLLQINCDKPMDEHEVAQQCQLPSLVQLIQEYHTRKDGCVTIHGHLYKVTHPLTICGWNKYTR